MTLTDIDKLSTGTNAVRLEDLHGEIEYWCVDRWVRATVVGPIYWPRSCDAGYPSPCRRVWNSEVQRYYPISQQCIDSGDVRQSA